MKTLLAIIFVALVGSVAISASGGFDAMAGGKRCVDCGG